MTFNFGSGTTPSTGATGTPTFSFGNQGASKPPVTFGTPSAGGQPSATPSFNMGTGAKPATGTTPSAFSFGTNTPSQGRYLVLAISLYCLTLL